MQYWAKKTQRENIERYVLFKPSIYSIRKGGNVIFVVLICLSQGTVRYDTMQEKEIFCLIFSVVSRFCLLLS